MSNHGAAGTVSGPVTAWIRALPGWSALADLALPAVCAGCGRPGLGWCDGCAAQLDRSRYAGPTVVRPDPAPAGLPIVVSVAAYAGVLRRVVTEFKDGGRWDMIHVLADLLATALEPLLRATGPVLVVPVPSSRASMRARGEAPAHLLASRAARLLPRSPSVAPALVVRRKVGDQARLGARARAANLGEAYAAHPRWESRLGGIPCLLVDDVLTTGATLAESARALRVAGATVAAAAVVADTKRRR